MRVYRLPAIYQWPESGEDGALLAYGPRILLCYRHVVSLVDKVLRGAKPADLPIEQPTKFELVVNLKTASVSMRTRRRCACAARWPSIPSARSRCGWEQPTPVFRWAMAR